MVGDELVDDDVDFSGSETLEELLESDPQDKGLAEESTELFDELFDPDDDTDGDDPFDEIKEVGGDLEISDPIDDGTGVIR
ncbi:hypothetical protein P4S72_03915 [Vibrio sp. PP-XX7]